MWQGGCVHGHWSSMSYGASATLTNYKRPLFLATSMAPTPVIFGSEESRVAF
jgi:hypothetical protein